MMQPEFTSDHFEGLNSFIDFNCASSSKSSPHRDERKIKKKTKTCKKSKKKKDINYLTLEFKNPVELINNLHSDTTWTLTVQQTNPKLLPYFQARLTFDEYSFVGKGRSKKIAKYLAAQAALDSLYRPKTKPSLVETNLTKPCVNPQPVLPIDDHFSFLYSHNLLTIISQKLSSKIKVILSQLPEANKVRVIAALVLTKDDDENWCDIVCITSGTKCVKGDELTMNGKLVNDCHAEILSRRSFICYLYHQLSTLISTNYKGNKFTLVIIAFL